MARVSAAANAPPFPAAIRLQRVDDVPYHQEVGREPHLLDHAELEDFALSWAREINSKSPTAMRMLKFGFNMIDDGLVGQQLFAGEATRLAYGTEEAQEGRDAFLEKRDPDWSPFPYYY